MAYQVVGDKNDQGQQSGCSKSGRRWREAAGADLRVRQHGSSEDGLHPCQVRISCICLTVPWGLCCSAIGVHRRERSHQCISLVCAECCCQGSTALQALFLTSSVKPGAMMVKIAGPIACPKLTNSHLKNSAPVEFYNLSLRAVQALLHILDACQSGVRKARYPVELRITRSCRVDGRLAGKLTGLQANRKGYSAGCSDDQGHLCPVSCCGQSSSRCCQALESTVIDVTDCHEGRWPASSGMGLP